MLRPVFLLNSHPAVPSRSPNPLLPSLHPQLIQSSQSLKIVGLSHNKIGKAGCQALADAIKKTTCLQTLHILPGERPERAGVRWGHSRRPMGPWHAHSLALHPPLSPCAHACAPFVCCLCAGNPVEEKDAKALAKALKRNSGFSIKSFLSAF